MRPGALAKAVEGAASPAVEGGDLHWDGARGHALQCFRTRTGAKGFVLSNAT